MFVFDPQCNEFQNSYPQSWLLPCNYYVMFIWLYEELHYFYFSISPRNDWRKTHSLTRSANISLLKPRSSLYNTHWSRWWSTTPLITTKTVHSCDWRSILKVYEYNIWWGKSLTDNYVATEWMLSSEFILIHVV